MYLLESDVNLVPPKAKGYTWVMRVPFSGEERIDKYDSQCFEAEASQSREAVEASFS